MTKFIQIHALVSYPPSNPNRDELGRPKTAVYGGVTRQRISSQSLKRAYRLGDPMRELDVQTSTRTRRIGVDVRNSLVELGVSEEKAEKWAAMIAEQFGSLDKKHDLHTNEIVIAGPEELSAVDSLVKTLAEKDREPTGDELEALEQRTAAIDVAMFGRMRADRKEVNVDAAVQVAHAITTNAVRVEADYWTAVDDLLPDTDSGAGGIGEREFSSGVFYLYACVDLPQLATNLGGNSELAIKAVEGLVKSIATVGPSGHQNSFANRAYAQYLRVEGGDMQPRSLVAAFESPLSGRNQGLSAESIAKLEEHAADMERAYGSLCDVVEILDVPGKRGSLESVLTAVREQMA